MIFSLILLIMTLEEILNVDWAEQTDLSEYVKYFEDQQILKQRLAYFTYQFLRSKLMSWREITEEGLENFNFFNFGYINLKYCGKSYHVTVLVGKRFIPFISLYEIERRTLKSLFRKDEEELRLDSLLDDIYWYYEKDLGLNVPSKQYIEALFLFEVIYEVCDDEETYYNHYNHDRFGRLKPYEIFERALQNPYIEIIEKNNIDERLSSYFGDHFNILRNDEIIKLRLHQKYSDKIREFKLDSEFLNSGNKLASCYYYADVKKVIDPEALFYINELGQPIYLTLESKFSSDYISTEVDLKKNMVKFLFKRGGYGETDNSVVFQTDTNRSWGICRIEEVTVDLNEDKIIEL